MAISAVAYRQQLQNEKFGAISRLFARGGGRTMTGFGGDLAGYNTSLIKKRADLEDQLMQKKYENGEISLDEMVAYLKKAATRSWVSPEEQKLIYANIQDMQMQKQDEVMNNRYKAGEVTAREMSQYMKNKLTSMNPGSTLYQNTLAASQEWEQSANREDVQLEEARKMAEVSAIEDPKEQALALEKAYDELADIARAKGFEEEAYGYEVKANNAKAKVTDIKEQESTNSAKNDRNNLISEFNLAVNDYHDNKLTGEQFLAKIDEMERKAISSGQSDLLNDFNQWIDSTREDMIYGKAWNRGGTRRGKAGAGSGASDAGSWVKDDKDYKERIGAMKDALLKGEITPQDYKEGMGMLLSNRADTLNQRIELLSNMDPTARIRYGSNKQVQTVMNELETELLENWGKPLGMTAAQANNVGLDAFAQDLAANGSAYVPVMSIVGSGPGARPQIEFQFMTPELERETIADAAGIRHFVKNAGKQTINATQFEQLPPEEKAKYETTDGENFTSRKEFQQKYVDVYGQNGEFIRYTLDSSNNIVGWDPYISSEGKKLPEGKNNFKEATTQPTTFETPSMLYERIQNEIANPQPVITPPTEAPKVSAADKAAEKMGYLKPSVIPPNLPIQDQLEVNPKAATAPMGSNEPAIRPKQEDPNKLTVAKPSSTNLALQKAFPNQSLKLDPKITGPVPTQQQLDTQYQDLQKQTQKMFEDDKKKQDSWLYNPIGKLKSTVSKWLGR